MPPTASVLEIVWTAIATAGFIGACGVAWFAADDWWWDRRHPPPLTSDRLRARLVSGTVFRNRLALAVMQAILVIFGLRAMALPPNPASGDLGTQFVGLLFVAGALAMSLTSMLDFRDRLRFRRLDGGVPGQDR